jgi:alkylated DNA repair dioxygenase AlkB
VGSTLPADPDAPSTRPDRLPRNDLARNALEIADDAPVKTALSAHSFFDYVPDWLEPGQLMQELVSQLAWEQREIVLFGRRIPQPRLIAWAGELPYRYSGQTLEPRAFGSALTFLRERVERFTGQQFNHALVNRYRDGNDSMGFHADAEPELGENPIVASVSLGATRRFVIEKKKDRKRFTLDLEHGSLLIMGGRCQHEFRHAVPKTRSPVGERINVTWRNLLCAPSNATD